MMFIIADCIVKIVAGPKTQTVNIRRRDAPDGAHDWIVRVTGPHFVDEQSVAQLRFASVEELIRHIEEHHAGRVERRPVPTRSADEPRPTSGASSNVVGSSQRSSRPEDRLAEAVHRDEDAWVRHVKVLVEHAIDQLVLEFAELPYLHRVEHSLHCELYSLLTANRTLGRPYPLAGGPMQTQLVHKEWPELVPRPEKNGRRGNFDVAILHPDHVKRATVKDFNEGRIAPVVAVEIGLNYGVDHLSNDVNKLLNSRIELSYVVHMSREANWHYGVENLLEGCPIPSAFASVDPSGARVKLIGASSGHSL